MTYSQYEEESLPECPVCGEECETLYMSGGDVLGCECCVSTKDSWEYAAERDQAAREYAEEMRFDDMRNDPDYHNRFENWR